MKGIRVLILGSLLALVSATSTANCYVNMCTDVQIEQIYVESEQNIWVQTSATETSLSVCTPDSGIFLWLDGSALQKKEVLSLLMLAYSMEKPVSIRVGNGARGCSIAYVLLDR